LRVLHVVGSRWLGGVERITALIVRTQAKMGHELHLACPSRCLLRPVCAAVRWRRKDLACPGRSWIAEKTADCAGILELPMKGAFGFATRRAVGRLVRYIGQQRIEIVHAHGKWGCLTGIPAARRAGVPSVTTVHGFGNDLTCADADRIVCVARAVADVLISRGVDARKVEVVYNGVELPDEIPARGTIREELGLSDDAPVVAMVARLTREKGCDVLLEAAALLPGVTLAIAGYGKPRYEAWLRDRAGELGIGDRTVFLGKRTDPEVVMAGADVVAVPSRMEACPLVPLEATSLGIAVVASDAGGTPEVVEHDVTGLVFPSENPAALANALNRLLADPDLRRQMGQASRKRVEERFTAERMCRELEAVYDGLRP